MATSIFVLGAAGMLGHRVYMHLRARYPEVACSVHGSKRAPPLDRVDLFQDGDVVEGVDAMDIPSVERMLSDRRPDVVINCVGVIKQRATAALWLPSITINALLPHRLAAATAGWGGRLIHFSTDCVFSGRKGAYTETDPSDAEDLYGKSKFLGEVATDNALTLRTSIIGRELSHHASLLDWFLAQRAGKCRGFTKHLYSGVTTLHLAEVVDTIVARNPGLHGLFQVTAPTITKYDLLCALRDAYGMDVEIVPDASTACDRSLVGAKLDGAIGRTPPSWARLCTQLAEDPTPYEKWAPR